MLCFILSRKLWNQRGVIVIRNSWGQPREIRLIFQLLDGQKTGIIRRHPKTAESRAKSNRNYGRFQSELELKPQLAAFVVMEKLKMVVDRRRYQYNCQETFQQFNTCQVNTDINGICDNWDKILWFENDHSSVSNSSFDPASAIKIEISN